MLPGPSALDPAAIFVARIMAMLEQDRFRSLIAGARTRDNRAVEELLAEYEPEIRRLVRFQLRGSRLRRALDSSDFCQSILLRLFQPKVLGRYSLRKPDEMLHLVRVMTRNKLYDYLRRERTRGKAGLNVLECPAEVLGQVPDRNPTPSKEVEQQELQQEFQRRLSPEERELAEQREAGLTWEQVAAGRPQSGKTYARKLMGAIRRVASELGLAG
jgi:RNA polymerase sigma factor (sigma-70 family)